MTPQASSPYLDASIARQVGRIVRTARLAAYGFDCERMLCGESEAPDVTEARILARMGELRSLPPLRVPGGTK